MTGVPELVEELRYVIDLTDDARKLARDLRTVDLAAWERLDQLLADLGIRGHHLAGQIAHQCHDCQAARLRPAQTVRDPAQRRRLTITWQPGNRWAVMCAVRKVLADAPAQLREFEIRALTCDSYDQLLALARATIRLVN